MSRVHAQIEIGPGDTLIVRDLDSRFGTSLNKAKLEPSKSFQVFGQQTVLGVGGSGTQMTLCNVTLSFCATRLDKQDKDKLKVILCSNMRCITLLLCIYRD